MQFISLLYFKVKCNLKSEAANSYLNYTWWLLEPIMQMAVFFIVFGIFLNRGTENFVVFLLCGLIPWLWFERTVSNASNSISDGRHLLSQIHIAKAFFPAVVILQDMVKQSLVFIMLLSAVILSGLPVNISWLGCIPIILTQLVFISFSAHLVAALVPFIPDLKFVISTFLQLMMFGSGVFYSYDVILPEHRDVFFLNPMAALINNYRIVLMDGNWPNFIELGYIFGFSMVGLLIVLLVLAKMSFIYPRVVLR